MSLRFPDLSNKVNSTYVIQEDELISINDQMNEWWSPSKSTIYIFKTDVHRMDCLQTQGSCNIVLEPKNSQGRVLR